MWTDDFYDSLFDFTAYLELAFDNNVPVQVEQQTIHGIQGCRPKQKAGSFG